MNFELLPFPNANQLACAAAEQWLGLLQSSTRRRETPYCVALSGGRIAREFFAAVAKGANSQQLGAVHFFWADERCVPPTDSESNFAVARELLLEPLGVPNDQIHRIRGEATPVFAAVEAEAELCRIAPLDHDGQPILDLIFLGMGEDGHVASLFPAELEMKSSLVIYRPVFASKLPRQRITINYGALSAAREVWVLASGPGKEEALRKSLSASVSTPLGRVIHSRKSTRIFTDVVGKLQAPTFNIQGNFKSQGPTAI